MNNEATHLVQVTEQTRDNTEGILHFPMNIGLTILTSADHRVLELLKMLTPLEPLRRHQDVKLPRSKNAGAWLLGLESFSKWRDSQTIEENARVFCCYGIPGAGKTVMRYLIPPSKIEAILKNFYHLKYS